MNTLCDLEQLLREWSPSVRIEESANPDFPPVLDHFVRLATCYGDEFPEYRRRFVTPPKQWQEFNDDPWEVDPPNRADGWVIADFDCEIPIPVWCTRTLDLSIFRPGDDHWEQMDCDFQSFAIGFFLSQLHRNWPIRLDHGYSPPTGTPLLFKHDSRWIGKRFFQSDGLLWDSEGSYVCAKTAEIASRHSQSWYQAEPRVT